MAEDIDTKHIDWMTLLVSSLEDPLGSAVTLSDLLSTNETLLKTYVTDELMDNFARMIIDVG